MLYISQLILQGQPLPCELHSSPLGKLSKTCTEAARRLLKVLKNLKENKFIALFGFFDLDGLISVSFVMILTAIFDSTCNDDHAIRPSPDLDEALGLVQFLANQGNKYAAQWLYEIRKTWEQLCSRVNNTSPHTNLPEQTQIHHQAPNETNDMLQPASNGSASSQAHVEGEVAGPFRIDGDQGQFELGVPNPASNLADLDIWADIDQLWQPLPDEWEAFQNGITVVPQNFSQAVPGDPHWPLAGEEMGDIFAELGRHVVGSVS
ncbi:hypothetical protein NPX13_g10486 [Xylaria arbuscula]|uniref:Uncharacterized protein n=1 Tax=Xylaria arbuscula TaxID=114810 RepID=A0A9W8N4P6_9PEZI|nr:hypothetical protein NPX13_g10486 [Xylaria arbuscula]